MRLRPGDRGPHRQCSAIGPRGTVSGHAAEAVEEHVAIYRAIRDGRPGRRDAAARAVVVRLDNALEDHRREVKGPVFG